MKSDQDSGFRWGPFEIRDDPSFQGRRPLRIQQKGGCVYYPYAQDLGKVSQHISDVNTEKPIIHKGNHFGHFTHARDYPSHCEWYFWDNCLLPQLMYRTEANPEGGKQWARIVKGSTMPGWITVSEDRQQYHSDRINDRLKSMSQGKIRDWQQLCRIETRPTGGRRVLLALSSELAVKHWYGLSSTEVEKRVREVCDRWGWHLDIRPKPDRRSREQGHSIQDQLQSLDYRCVVTVNSTAAIECLSLGVPVVALGAHNIASQCTPWKLFERNWFCPPVPEWVRLRQQQLLALTWHKQELLDGTWALSPEVQCAEPFTKWSLFDD